MRPGFLDCRRNLLKTQGLTNLPYLVSGGVSRNLLKTKGLPNVPNLPDLFTPKISLDYNNMLLLFRAQIKGKRRERLGRLGKCFVCSRLGSALGSAQVRRRFGTTPLGMHRFPQATMPRVDGQEHGRTACRADVRGVQWQPVHVRHAAARPGAAQDEAIRKADRGRGERPTGQADMNPRDTLGHRHAPRASYGAVAALARAYPRGRPLMTH